MKKNIVYLLICFVSITFFGERAKAHGDQEVLYLGTECRLRGDFERGRIQACTSPTNRQWWWRNLLGISGFGTISNLYPCGNPLPEVPTNLVPDFQISPDKSELSLTCPIVRGAIRKNSGIEVHVKYQTRLNWDANDNQNERINKNFRCELLNIRADGFQSSHHTNTGSDIVSNQTAGNSAGNNITQRRTTLLNLDSSNAASSRSASNSGGYVLNCVLPGIRDGVVTRLIHYTVKEKD